MLGKKWQVLIMREKSQSNKLLPIVNSKLMMFILLLIASLNVCFDRSDIKWENLSQVKIIGCYRSCFLEPNRDQRNQQHGEIQSLPTTSSIWCIKRVIKAQLMWGSSKVQKRSFFKCNKLQREQQHIASLTLFAREICIDALK